jgi:hypothetical protein
LLPGRKLMSGVTLEAGIMNLAHQVAVVEVFRDGGGIFLLLPVTDTEGAQAAQSLEAIEWGAGQAQAIGPPDERFEQFIVLRQYGAAHHVGMSIDVLGGGMQDDVRTELERPLFGR